MSANLADQELAEKIASLLLGKPIDEVTPIYGKGIVNQIFTVRVAADTFVVRMSQPADADRALPFYEKEVWCLEQAAALGIPGPKVLQIGRYATRPYMLQTFVAGKNVEDCAMDQRDIWAVLGRYARQIHGIALDGFGERLTDFHKGEAAKAWRTFIDYNLNSLTPEDELLRLNVYQPDQVHEIRKIFQQLRQTNFRFGLNHNDLALRNTVVDETGKVNLLDWGSAEAHLVPHYDFLEILRWHRPNDERFLAFLDGYGMREHELAPLLREVQSLALLKAFDLTRWAIDRCPARIEEIADRARQVVHEHFFS